MGRIWAVMTGLSIVWAVVITASSQVTSVLSFEVASIKPNNSGPTAGGSISTPGGRFHAVNARVKMLITYAYTLPDFRIIGGPDWINTAGFDIDAIGGPEFQQIFAESRGLSMDSAPAKREMSSLTGMLQQLLADRFQLKSHIETRDLPIYELSIAKGGPNLQSTSRPQPLGPDDLLKNPNPAVPPPGVSWNRFGTIAGSAVEIADLLARLSQQLKTPVVDKTGLSSAKGPVEVLVIDSVQKPMAN